MKNHVEPSQNHPGHESDHRQSSLLLRERLGTQGPRRRRAAQVLGLPHHPEIRYGHARQDRQGPKGRLKNVPTLEAIAKPIHDGDVEKPDDPAYANAYYISANSLTAPGIVDAACNPILDHSEVYSGVYGRASVNFYVYSNGVNKGIAAGLNNLQKLSDGEPLGSKATPESDFGDGDGFLD